MELFAVNRHLESEATGTNDNEQEKLNNYLQRIEKNKKRRERQRAKEIEERTKKESYIESRRKKKAWKDSLIKLPKTDEFIDPNIANAIVPEVKETGPEKPRKSAGKLDVDGFTVLGGDQFSKKAKVKRVLPRWLTNPKIISMDLQNLKTKVSSMKLLNKELRNELKGAGLKYFFPVQAEVIPWLLRSNSVKHCIPPQDICVSAPTGSGKTLAFVLPIIQALQDFTTKKIRALIILPTQDLALQVFKTFKKFTGTSKLDVCIITGHSPFVQEQKMLVEENIGFGCLSKVDILVCTAGRLVDHLKGTPGFTLGHLEFLVIDEADRVLDNVQNDWLYHLEKHIYKDATSCSAMRTLNLNSLKTQRSVQKLLFSATLSQDPEKLQKLGLFQPKLFTSITDEAGAGVDENQLEISDRFLGKYTTPKELTEKFIVSSLDLKPLVLYEFIKSQQLSKTIVFTHSVESTHRLHLLLKVFFEQSLKVEEIGSMLDTNKRKKLIEDFEKGNIDILVCTDALARGIDLAGVKCVISYSLPKYLKTYIHRAGRTARAGEEGLAVTLVQKNQLAKFQSMLEQGSKKNVEEFKINEEELEPLGDKYQEALQSLKKTINTEEDRDLQKTKAAKRLKRKRVNSE